MKLTNQIDRNKWKETENKWNETLSDKVDLERVIKDSKFIYIYIDTNWNGIVIIRASKHPRFYIQFNLNTSLHTLPVQFIAIQLKIIQ